MSAMSNKNLEMHEIAEGGSDEAKIKEFGSVAKAAEWLAEQERWEDEAAKGEAEALAQDARENPDPPRTHGE